MCDLTVYPHESQIVNALHELTDTLRAQEVQPRTIALNVSRVIERSGLGRLNLIDYMQEHGFRGQRLAVAIGTFGKTVADTYRERYGHDPLEHIHDENGHIVNLYLELDRPLVDEAFRTWSA